MNIRESIKGIFFNASLDEGDSSELKMGIEVEKEHANMYDELKGIFSSNEIEMPWTLDEFAEKIAKAHVDEISDYYTRLKKMEAGN